MKLLKILLIIIIFKSTSIGQVLKGFVVDARTNNKIELASIYINGAFTGTTTNKDGYFELSVARFKSIPIIVSAVGYYSKTLNSYSLDQDVVVKLEPKVYNIDEVIIAVKDGKLRRKLNIRLFKDQFLGTTFNSKYCRIENESDIYFQTHQDTLTAISLKPLYIINEALGYKIFYYLEKFEYHKRDNSFYFRGNMVFMEDMQADEKQRMYYKQRRQKTYLGSRMHFFRSLYANHLSNQGFSLNYPEEKDFVYQLQVVSSDSSKKLLMLPNNLSIKYKNFYSRVETKKQSISFDASGYYDPTDVLWLGQMATSRVADMLPLEYDVDN